jgi:hypothetical protein
LTPSIWGDQVKAVLQAINAASDISTLRAERFSGFAGVIETLAVAR